MSETYTSILPIQGIVTKPCPTCPYPFGLRVIEGEGATTGIIPYVQPSQPLPTAGPWPGMQFSEPAIFGGVFQALDRPLQKELVSFSNS
jgi:hypothetical protein